MGVFIDSNSLENLKKYKYSAEDHSLISKYVLKHFWSRFVLLFPMWLAPNLVTLIGFFFVLVNVFTVHYYDPSLNASAPSWAYLTYALGLFLYQTFDACDGGQARRTGQSGPLGELFDHCVDAINTSLGVYIFASASNLGYGWCLVLAQFATLCNFYMSTWEEYNTGTLYLSAFSGPVEGILIVVFLFILVSFTGPQIFHTSFANIIGVNTGISYLNMITPIQVYLVFGVVALGFNIRSACVNVLKSRRTRGLPTRGALSGLIPFFAFYVSVFTWVYVCPAVLTQYGFPFLLIVGLSNAFMVGRIILAHLTKTDFPYFHFVTLLPSVCILLHFLGIAIHGSIASFTFASVYMSLGVCTVTYGFFVMEIINEITTYLDIWCLTIKHPKDVTKQE
ncbi:ethanolaminephosphotransferase [Nadsonia fulvescens var. elongata DSM 6958]|uniref:diacylglycerol cholinephosphotransferase n=1 Tax=Nadsonia fulvescens var. elongata DSM 6958 TaxID=857566 RepID=A0A1E3PG46_9ASCO|nr:ethanolaminephosphotransferase [Nadsonia fulvescens var. elongata DSM 6958]